MMRERQTPNKQVCARFTPQWWRIWNTSLRAITSRVRRGGADKETRMSVPNNLSRYLSAGLFLCDIFLWSLFLPLNPPWTTEMVEMPPGWLSIDRIKVKHLSVQCTWADAQAAYVSLRSVIFVIHDLVNHCSHFQSPNMTFNTRCVYSKPQHWALIRTFHI